MIIFVIFSISFINSNKICTKLNFQEIANNPVVGYIFVVDLAGVVAFEGFVVRKCLKVLETESNPVNMVAFLGQRLNILEGF